MLSSVLFILKKKSTQNSISCQSRENSTFLQADEIRQSIELKIAPKIRKRNNQRSIFFDNFEFSDLFCIQNEPNVGRRSTWIRSQAFKLFIFVAISAIKRGQMLAGAVLNQCKHCGKSVWAYVIRQTYHVLIFSVKIIMVK